MSVLPACFPSGVVGQRRVGSGRCGIFRPSAFRRSQLAKPKAQSKQSKKPLTRPSATLSPAGERAGVRG